MSVDFKKPKVTPWQDHYENDKRQKDVNKTKIQKEKHLAQSAQEEGIVNHLVEKDLVKYGRNEDDKQPSYPGDAYSVQLSCKRLRNISLIDLCERLTICNLSNNFLQSIKALKWCSNLICLDVHSNQISRLPGGEFWSTLSKLKILYMHDNGVFKLEELKHLSDCPTLFNMTLYDTPLSLKRNYRHCVVNAVWTLKALDHCVISDEEIIEDANFSKQYKPMQAQFFFQSPFLNANKSLLISYKESLSLIKKELSLINSIQAKWCPVLILQRCIRGFLVRLRYNYIVDTRLWAAVSIQRFYRTVKGEPSPPPSSPIIAEHANQSLSSMKLDYETYLKIRRSKHKSFLSIKSEKSITLPQWHKYIKSPDSSVRKRISINLEKLEGKATQMLKDSKIRPNVVGQIPHKKEVPRIIHSAPVHKESEPEDVLRIAHELGLNMNKGLKMHSKIGKYHTQYEFFGKVVQNTSDYDDSFNGSSFRLSIKKPYVMKHDPLEELILRTVEGADDIRKSIREIEKRIKSVPPPKKVSNKKEINADQKLYLKTQGSMGLSCFRAVDKAYKDRQNAEQLLKRMNHVNNIREVERKCIEKVNQHKSIYRNSAAVKKHSERIHIREALVAKRNIESELYDNVAVERTARKLKQEKSHSNYKFAITFNCQNASVGKALANHDREIRKDEIMDNRTKYVTNIKEDLETKKDLVSVYLKDLKLMRQANTLTMKDKLESMLHKNTIERKNELLKLLKTHEEKNEQKLKFSLPVKELLTLSQEENQFE